MKSFLLILTPYQTDEESRYGKWSDRHEMFFMQSIKQSGESMFA